MLGIFVYQIDEKTYLPERCCSEVTFDLEGHKLDMTIASKRGKTISNNSSESDQLRNDVDKCEEKNKILIIQYITWPVSKANLLQIPQLLPQ